MCAQRTYVLLFCFILKIIAKVDLRKPLPLYNVQRGCPTRMRTAVDIEAALTSI